MTTTNPNLPETARCFCCGTRTQTLQPQEDCMEGSTAWKTGGNYGSVVVDNTSADEPVLEIQICDVCLLMRRDRVLQFDATKSWKERQYETWKAPTAGGLDLKRRVVIVWETEDGKFHAADLEGGGGSYHGLTEALEQSTERVIRSREWLDKLSTISTCRNRLLRDISETKCPGDIDGLTDCTGPEPTWIPNVQIHLETKLRPGSHASVVLGPTSTLVRNPEYERDSDLNEVAHPSTVVELLAAQRTP